MNTRTCPLDMPAKGGTIRTHTCFQAAIICVHAHTFIALDKGRGPSHIIKMSNDLLMSEPCFKTAFIKYEQLVEEVKCQEMAGSR